ncbi:hypothetical protein K493DRAFT_317741 [Basidiobolus meristosporus CBS 931.73]|uniref:Uncharacterized protein n=1 Tax=Basidiobolus meristosporus CBS 931.73 TaxID=1314790 RepID=A0A1Y1XYC1_9FUNG|nr:hypothetical protein K493DRAFT_317741 [Basidiobolus meristosporus CBS 931.73]|eukprot:ORX90748.1 hypothetical protein K493DRAFT_317741 [Basidiobolus meristosporus CBS 931.73]
MINQLMVEDQQLVERGNEVLCLEYQILAIKLKLLEFSVVRTQVVYEIEERDNRIHQKRLQLKQLQKEFNELGKLSTEPKLPRALPEKKYQYWLVRSVMFAFVLFSIAVLGIRY